MFINRMNGQSKSHKMSYLNAFLKTEVTCIPKILRKCFGDYYNNALSNGATWVFVLWTTLHMVFDTGIDTLLKKLRYREYVRSRLKKSLWYLGFYGTASVYCGVTLSRDEIELFNFKKMLVLSSNPLPTQMILGYTLISTFYLHSALWEGLKNGRPINMFRFMFLFAFMVFSYILRIVETSFSLTALISTAQIGLEFTRSAFITSEHENLIVKIFLTSLFVAAFLIYIAIHLVVIPLTFVVPLGLKIMSDYPNWLLIFLFISLVAWMVVEIYQSVLFKVVDHSLYHRQRKEKSDSDDETNDIKENIQCALIECALFEPRDDFAYNMGILKKEITDRKNKKMAMRKPKNVFFQTLKCMVAMKKKLSEKRFTAHSQLDDNFEDSNEEPKENVGLLKESNLGTHEDDYNLQEKTLEDEKEQKEPRRSEETLLLPSVTNDDAEVIVESEVNPLILMEEKSDFESKTA